jgi:hypothetical protein
MATSISPKVTRVLLCEAVSYYEHLLKQGLSQANAEAHVKHRYGIQPITLHAAQDALDVAVLVREGT